MWLSGNSHWGWGTGMPQHDGLGNNTESKGLDDVGIRGLLLHWRDLG